MSRNFSRKLIGITISALVLGLMPGSWSPAAAVEFQFNDASLELSDSNPASPANWTLTIKTVTQIDPGDTLVITPEATRFSIPAAMDHEDLDLSVDNGATDELLAAAPGEGADTAWGVAVTDGTSGSITLTNNDTDTVAAGSTIIIEIGTHATSGSAGAEQITNPTKVAAAGTADIREVDVTTKDASNASATMDTIDLVVAIIEDIDLYAAQAPQMTMTIAGQSAPSGGAISATAIEWGEITPGVAETGTMRVKVNTDAKDGFTVYVKQNNNMQHSEDSGIDIDPINNSGVGTNDSPVAWTSPTGTTIAVNTAFLGYTTSDATLNNVGDGVDRFTNGGAKYAGLTTTSEEILFHNAASQSDVDGQDRADVTFQLETNNLQPSGNYTNEITFIAKPVF